MAISVDALGLEHEVVRLADAREGDLAERRTRREQ